MSNRLTDAISCGTIFINDIRYHLDLVKVSVRLSSSCNRRPRVRRHPVPPLRTIVGERGATLFNQQCWLWGYDIRRAAGNLLLAYGFSRSVPPDGEQGSRTYTLVQREAHIALWAFGMWYGVPGQGAVFINRFEGVPRYIATATPATPIWRPDQIELPQTSGCSVRRRAARELAVASFTWLADYERWVLATSGLEYRVAAVAAWERGPYRIAATAIASEWDRLALACRLPTPHHHKEAIHQPLATHTDVLSGEGRISQQLGDVHVSG
jgi:hypothetical protein